MHYFYLNQNASISFKYHEFKYYVYRHKERRKLMIMLVIVLYFVDTCILLRHQNTYDTKGINVVRKLKTEIDRLKKIDQELSFLENRSEVEGAPRSGPSK